MMTILIYFEKVDLYVVFFSGKITRVDKTHFWNYLVRKIQNSY